MTEEQATEKQVKFMIQLGIEPRDAALMTKEDAKRTIQGLLMAKEVNKDEEVEPEVEKIPLQQGGRVFKLPKDNGFHLTPEQVRSNALASAIEWVNKEDVELDYTMKIAKGFEQYILTGE